MSKVAQDEGQPLTDNFTRGFQRRRNRCSILQPQRVLVSASTERELTDDDTDQATPSIGSVTAHTFSAMLAARHDQPPETNTPNSADHDKENTADRRAADTNPFELLSIPRRGTTPSAARSARKPLSLLEPALKEAESTPHAQPAVSSDQKQPAGVGEPGSEKHTLSHARSQTTLAASADRPPALARGASDTWLPGRVLSGSAVGRTGTPPEAGNFHDHRVHTPPEQLMSAATIVKNESKSLGRPTVSSVITSSTSAHRVVLQAQRVPLHTGAASSHADGYKVLASMSTCTTTSSVTTLGRSTLQRQETPRPARVPTSSYSQSSVYQGHQAPYTSEARFVSQERHNSGAEARGYLQNLPARMASFHDSATKLSAVSKPQGMHAVGSSVAVTDGSQTTLSYSSCHTPAPHHSSASAPVSSTNPVAAKESSVAAATTGHSNVHVATPPMSSVSAYRSSRTALTTCSITSKVDSSMASSAATQRSVSVTTSALSTSARPISSPSVQTISLLHPSTKPTTTATATAATSAPSNTSPPVQLYSTSHPGPNTTTAAPFSSKTTTSAAVPAVAQVSGESQCLEPDTQPMPPPPAPVSMLFGKTLRPVTVNGQDYIVLKQIGRGGSSKVYQVLDVNMRLLALKQVFLETVDDTTAEGYMNEIDLLRRLRRSDRVINLIDFEHNKSRQLLYLLMERGETDLSALLKTYSKLNEVDANMCKFFWGEMLRCVDVIHKEGIIHQDLKPSNFLLVSGRLKLIDFGIASRIQSDCTSVLKDTQVGTFNYMSPEAIEAQQVTRNGTSQTAIKVSRRSDVWSLGCILYYFVYGVTPFGHFKQMMGKLLAIVNPNHVISFPDLSDHHLLGVIKACLQRDPYQRPDIAQLLNHPYLVGH